MRKKDSLRSDSFDRDDSNNKKSIIEKIDHDGYFGLCMTGL